MAGLLTVGLTHAQDTIYTRNGSVINGKVAEITQAEIKYKKASNPDGPVYSMGKEDVVLIHYRNGSKDVFASNSPNPNDPSVVQNNQQQQQMQQQAPPVVNNNNYYSSGGYGYGGYGYGGGVRVYVGPGPFFRPPGFYYGYRRPYYYHHRRWCW